MPELKPGQRLSPRFTAIRSLGAGGMGEVWLVRDEELGSEVVAKVVPAEATSDQIALLRQECRSARRLNHPNIVRVFDFHQSEGRSFITMQYLSGGDAGSLRAGPPADVLETILPLVEALEYAHGQGVVHRDLKPSNVLLDDGGAPHLADFGIAGLLAPSSEDLVLSGGGTRFRVSPQQRRGEPPVPADDVYGLGILLYELVSGENPLDAGSAQQADQRAVPPLVKSGYFVPKSLQELVGEMMAEEADLRTENMQVVRQRLVACLRELYAESTLPPESTTQTIRLAPPPRVEPTPPVEASGRGAANRTDLGSGRDWQRALTGLTFLTAILAVIVVFFFLPSWVEQNAPDAQGETAAEVEKAAPDEAVEMPSPEREPVGAQAGPVADLEHPAEPEKPPARQEKRQPPGRTEVQPVPAPARQTADEVSFASAMSEGLGALDRGDFTLAESSFQRALEIRPGSTSAAEGLGRAQQELRLIGIAAYRRSATAFVEQEQWHQALAEFDAALVIDPTIRFAQEGRAQAKTRAELDDQLAYHLAHLDRLSSDEVLAEVTRLVDRARRVEPLGSRLQQQIESLDRELRVAAIPIQVVLISDNLTEVMVYRVGRLGRFERQTLELRPGTYTVVGSRDGYRDVRRQVRVVAGTDPEPLTVRCEEEI